MAWLLDQYRATTVWAGLAKATRSQRDNIFSQILKTAGGKPFARIDEAAIVQGRERRKDTPHQARNYLDAMRGLFRWAKEAKHVAVDPTASVKNPKRPKQAVGGGFRPWTEEDMVNYDKRWPIGTRQRVWRDVIAYSGLRRGDAVRLGRQHVRKVGGRPVAQITTEKSQFTLPVTLPILPVLQATLDAGPTSDLAFICGARGGPLKKESFGNMFREACDAAGVKGSAHGIRKIAAMRAALNGATVSQLNALFGWKGSAMATLYTEAASRVKLSSESIDKLLGELPEPPALDDEDEQNCNIYSLTSAGGEGKNAKS